jgi:hypothetical protein
MAYLNINQIYVLSNKKPGLNEVVLNKPALPPG